MKHSKLKEKSEKVLKKGHKASRKKLLALVELLEDKKQAYKAKLEKGA